MGATTSSENIIIETDNFEKIFSFGFYDNWQYFENYY